MGQFDHASPREFQKKIHLELWIPKNVHHPVTQCIKDFKNKFLLLKATTELDWSRPKNKYQSEKIPHTGDTESDLEKTNSMNSVEFNFKKRFSAKFDHYPPNLNYECGN